MVSTYLFLNYKPLKVKLSVLLSAYTMACKDYNHSLFTRGWVFVRYCQLKAIVISIPPNRSAVTRLKLLQGTIRVSICYLYLKYIELKKKNMQHPY